jgi:hypothetical protein
MMGGLRYDEEGRLRHVPSITKGDYENWFSLTVGPMVDEEDEATGESYVVDRFEIPLIEAGQFDNVQANPSLQHFIRDDLMEPD